MIVKNTATSEDTLYVIYTSGTTGRPKGIQLKHKNLINLIYFQKQKTNIEFDKVLQFASLSFDVCYQEIFSTLLSGGMLHLIHEEKRKDINLLYEYINKHNIHTIFFPTAFLKFISSEDEYIDSFPKVVKHIVTAGEQLIISEKLRKLLKENEIYLHNHYGPSETHVATTNTISPQEGIAEIPSIGKPINNTKIYILDKSKNILPIGVSGELFISGDCVGKGYIYNKSLTDEKFTMDPYDNRFLMYETGDLAKWTSDGSIEYLGRRDHQVKIRGFRIELGEIESQLMKFSGINSTVVIDKEDHKKNKYLVAYYVSNIKIKVTELRAFLAKELPNFMIPQYFVQLEKLPLTHNGKIDSKVLGNIKFNELSNNKEIVKPLGKVEEDIYKIFTEVLNNSNISVIDSFFDIGGDSLLSIKLSILSKKYNYDIRIQDIYTNKSIREISKMIMEKNKTDYLIGKRENIQFENKIHFNKKGKDGLKNILLTGATGFLGAHLLSDLLKMTSANITCLVRGNSQMDSYSRFKTILNYYFGEKFYYSFENRIKVLNGDVSNSDFSLDIADYDSMGNFIDAVFHSAAIVKHFGEFTDFEKININGTNHIIQFCKRFGIEMHYISTIGVTGREFVQTERIDFNEGDLEKNQNFDNNPYLISKFIAERNVIKEVKNGLKCVIYRVGNLTARINDGKFQMNKNENAFFAIASMLMKLKIIPSVLLKFPMEFTFIDCCSEAVLKLALNEDSNMMVHHIYNDNLVNLKYFLGYVNKKGINIRFFDEEIENKSFFDYAKGLVNHNDSNLILMEAYSQILNKNLYNENHRMFISSEKTKKDLELVGFKWPKVGNEYIYKFLEID